jgi:hypothetical protein
MLAPVGDGRRIETTRSVSSYTKQIGGTNLTATDVIGINGSHLRFTSD